jgi:hypothetical protein
MSPRHTRRSRTPPRPYPAVENLPLPLKDARVSTRTAAAVPSPTAVAAPATLGLPTLTRRLPAAIDVTIPDDTLMQPGQTYTNSAPGEWAPAPGQDCPLFLGRTD